MKKLFSSLLIIISTVVLQLLLNTSLLAVSENVQWSFDHNSLSATTQGTNVTGGTETVGQSMPSYYFGNWIENYTDCSEMYQIFN